MEDFEREATTLNSLKHRNVVQYFGQFTSSSGERYIVTEFLPLGSLDHLLETHRHEIKSTDLLAMTKDAAEGMNYLSKQKIVHGDLALRNLLVTSTGTEDSKYIIKVADFGMSRVLAEKDYTSLDNDKGILIPVRWTAPEVFDHGKISIQSDVWSFGVLLWELFSYGKRPYPGISNKEIVSSVQTGEEWNLQKVSSGSVFFNAPNLG